LIGKPPSAVITAWQTVVHADGFHANISHRRPTIMYVDAACPPVAPYHSWPSDGYPRSLTSKRFLATC